MSQIEKEGRAAIATCCAFIEALHNSEFDKIQGWVSDNFEVYWPLTREKVNGIENFIAIKQQEKKCCEVRVQNTMYEFDEWDKSFKVSLQISLYNDGEFPPSGWDILFFDLDYEGTIIMLTEYFINCCEQPPLWRKDLVELY